MPARRDLPLVSADILARIRARRPRVHCITNAVAQNFTANMLLAAGAVPSMTIASDEIADFVARADALLVNLGTLDPERRGAIQIAIAAAGETAARAGGSSIPSPSIARCRGRVSPAPWWRGGRARSGSTGRNFPRLPAARR